ncbi:DUF418 domain-containing protein [Desulfobacula sp.]|uniref:DUF418 domain-containing protein n=1 Tax=Desulfobacula sp. TaxID=2593537 RepID=UPI0026287696|nr:DUF418 domain-containing protein [Desulfobacula sp.]
MLGGLAIFISSEMISGFFTSHALLLVSEPGKIYTTLELFCLGLGWLTSIDLTIPTPFSVISGIGTGITVIMISISLSTGQNVQWARHIAIAGRNTLTLYITHIIFLILVIPIFNISNGSNLSLITLGGFVFFFTFIKLISCWLKKHKKGPLEMLMRKFSVRRLIVGRTKTIVENQM